LDTTGSKQMQVASSNTTSEEDNDGIAVNAADDNDDDDAVSSDKRSVDDDVARTEKYLRLYFYSLAKPGTIQTVEEVTAKLSQVLKQQN